MFAAELSGAGALSFVSDDSDLLIASEVYGVDSLSALSAVNSDLKVSLGIAEIHGVFLSVFSCFFRYISSRAAQTAAAEAMINMHMGSLCSDTYDGIISVLM